MSKISAAQHDPRRAKSKSGSKSGSNFARHVSISIPIQGVILAALGLAMMLTGDVATVRAIIALGAMAFVFILPLLVIALLKTLGTEERT